MNNLRKETLLLLVVSHIVSEIEFYGWTVSNICLFHELLFVNRSCKKVIFKFTVNNIYFELIINLVS